MSVPTNTSFLTATPLAAFPVTVTQRVDDAGVTYNVYYSFTATQTGMMGAWAFGDLVTYRPTLHLYEGPASAPVGPVLNILPTNVPGQFPVTSGTDYLFEISPNLFDPSPANLTLQAEYFTPAAAPVGSICVPDDRTGFPLALLSGTVDYTPLRYVLDFPAGEAGDTLSDGTVLVQNIATQSVDLYTQQFALVSQTVLTSSALPIRTCLGVDRFYVGKSANPPSYRTIDRDGTVSAAVTLTGAVSLSSLAAANDESVLYYTQAGTNKAVQQWDIPGNIAAANLVAGVANYQTFDVLVLGDDSIVVAYVKSSATKDFKVLRYDAAGWLLSTYLFGEWTNTQPRLAYALNDPTSFWVWMHRVATVGLSQFLNVKVSDGSILTTRLGEEFEVGAYQGTPTATPLSRFGHSFSCPFWILRAGQVTTQTFPMRRQRRFLLQSSPDNKQMQCPTLELLMRTGIGLLPGPATDPPVQGSDPTVMVRLSKDGGKTWGPERWVSAGKMGEYANRVRLLRFSGNYRNAVVEVTVSDPVDWQFLAALAPNGITEGSS